MITYKGSPLVVGKRFYIESEIAEYQGKIFGNMHKFTTKDNQEIILTEQEAKLIKPYRKLNEHSLLAEQDNSDELYQIVASYTDTQLKLLDIASNKFWNEMKKSMQEEIDKLKEHGCSYQVSYQKMDANKSYLQEVIMDFLQETSRNLSEVSMPNIYVKLNNFIYNIDRIVGDK